MRTRWPTRPLTSLPDDRRDSPERQGHDEAPAPGRRPPGAAQLAGPAPARPRSPRRHRREVAGGPVRPPFPRTMISPARQSMSSSERPATSPARSPRRDSTVIMAKSRRPTPLRRSQLLSRRATCPWPKRLLATKPRRQCATEGTASARASAIEAFDVEEPQQRPQPRRHGLRRPVFQRRDSASTNRFTSAAVTVFQASSPSLAATTRMRGPPRHRPGRWRPGDPARSSR